jgi:hypothetical protein
LILKEISRARFLKMLMTGAVCLPGAAAFGGAMDKLRGDRVGWVRLKTTSPAWKRHANGDPKMMQFFRGQTTLNVDLSWYEADVENAMMQGS